MIEPRGWQTKAVERFKNEDAKAFLVNACPGAGKTIFSGICSRHAIDSGEVDFVVIVVPTTALKGDKAAGFLGDWNKVGIQITTVLKDGKGRPEEFSGAVVTYQQLGNLLSTFDAWVGGGLRLMFVFDEIHHASESNTWGMAVDRCGELAVKVLAMTGTPFRGDGSRISFVRYDQDGKAKADATYTYQQAVADRVCRPVEFMTDDGLAQYIYNEQEEEIRISEATADDEASKAARVIFSAESDWLRQVIEKADSRLEQYRVADIDAGGIVICRPGKDERDDRHLLQVAKVLKAITGETPEVITHDDQDANAKIERFREGSSKWICSVRKISEGVDIKRLRVMVMANNPGTELLFRQLVGRVVRVEDRTITEDATIFMAKFPQLVGWAKQIMEEASAGLRTREAEDEAQQKEMTEERVSSFVALGATHEHGGGVSSYGETFQAHEINFAESFKRGDPQMTNIPATVIAHIFRKANVQAPADVAVTEPLAVQKTRVRKSLNNLARQYAFMRNPDKPDFSGVFQMIHRFTGAKNLDDLHDNHSIDKMRQVERALRTAIAGSSDAAAA